MINGTGEPDRLSLEANRATGEQPRIVIVGAGPGGMVAAIKLRQAGFDNFVILERGGNVGGTWYNNRYPGLACDVPSLLYCLSFEQKSDWPTSHATQPEIEAYLQEVARKHDLLGCIRFGAEVVAARWCDSEEAWTIELADGSQIDAEIFISALGMFNELQWPNIAGLDSFAGEVIHPGRWPEKADLEGKRVAVIGSAASAVQIVPEILRDVEKVYLFQRTPQWVLPKEEEFYSEAELDLRRREPAIGLAMRQELYDYFEHWLTWDDKELLAQLQEKGLGNLAKVQDPQLRQKLRPTVPFGAQRTLISDKYYEAFNDPRLELVTEHIRSVSDTGVVTVDGMERSVDVIICATGYKATKFLSVIEVTGRGGRSLHEDWADGAQAYKGVVVSGYPNLFMLYGPNTNQGALLLMLEMEADYLVGKLKLMRDRNARWLEVRSEAMQEYNEEIQKRCLELGIFDQRGTKYYRSESGRIVTQYPGTMGDYLKMTTAPDEKDFELGLDAGSPKETSVDRRSSEDGLHAGARPDGARSSATGLADVGELELVREPRIPR